MSHDHDHQHHDSTPRAFAIAVALNVTIVVLEAVYGVVAHSMSLLADAGHNLGGVLGLVLAGWRKPTKRHTYGLRRLTLLAALANGVFLLVATGAIAWEWIRRFGAPQPVSAISVGVIVGSDRPHGLALDRSGAQPRRRDSDPREHVVSPASFPQPRARRGAGRNRHRRSSRVPRFTAARKRSARSSRVADQHYGDGAHRASRDAWQLV
jgi:hypothetical protein